ncbi:MAG: AsmA family protein [Gammaproteobacteria bacterium]
MKLFPEKAPKTLILLVVVIYGLVFIPYFISLESYKPEIEKRLSTALEKTVRIEDAGFRLLPIPVLTAEGISMVGNNKTSGEIFIKSMSVLPDFKRLIDGQFSIKHLYFSGVATNQLFVQSQIKQFRNNASMNQANTQINVDKITIDGITIRADESRYGPYKINMTLTQALVPEKIKILRSDGSINALLSRQDDHYAINLTARNWLLPIGPKLKISELSANGSLRSGQMDFSRISMTTYNGLIDAKVTLDWKKNFSVDGRVNATDINMAPIIKVFNGRGFTGQFSGDLAIHLKGKKINLLLQQPLIEGPFSITDGKVFTDSPSQPIVVFNKFSANGKLTRTSLATRDAELVIYQGRASGNPRLSWQTGWQLDGQIQLAGIELEPLVTHIIKRKVVTGILNGIVNVDLRANRFSQLIKHPVLSGNLRASEGSIFTRASATETLRYALIKSDAEMRNDRILMSNTSIEAYNGKINGTVDLSWRKDWKASCNAAVKGIDVESLLSGFHQQKTLTGSIDGQTQVFLSGNTFTSLIDNPLIDADFNVINGTLFRADLKEASTNLSKDNTVGGQTPFKQLKGHANIKNGHIALSKLDITSSALVANGDLNIDENDQLKGELDVGIRHTATLISIPIVVSGTTHEPHLRPTSEAVIGGTIGTSILGPGLGTAVGIKAGKIIKSIGNKLSGGS